MPPRQATALVSRADRHSDVPEEQPSRLFVRANRRIAEFPRHPPLCRGACSAKNRPPDAARNRRRETKASPQNEAAPARNRPSARNRHPTGPPPTVPRQNRLHCAEPSPPNEIVSTAATRHPQQDHTTRQPPITPSALCGTLAAYEIVPAAAATGTISGLPAPPLRLR